MSVNATPLALLALTLAVAAILAILAAIAAGVLARMDGASQSAAIQRAAVAFAGALTLITAVLAFGISALH